MKKILKFFNKKYIASLSYVKYYEKLEINEKVIFLEAQNGRNANGNIFYIAQELNNNEEYRKFDIYVSIDSKVYKKTKKSYKAKGLNNIIFVKAKSKKYYELLATAKYLITDISFDPCYIKKEGQVILNTWHGTPLKTLGRKVNGEFHDLGNIQKNFIQADYLLYPNEYMMNHMIKDYMIENLSNAKIILEGYPRNTVFFDENLKNKIRKEQGLENKEIFVYMPTWRGIVTKVQNDEQQNEIQVYLEEIDRNLKENQEFFVNLHPFVNDIIDYTKLKKIKKFPKEYETYQFLAIADCLITDYSSVFYDFANTHKKIILFAYDEEEYLHDRGLYISFDELPFTKVDNIADLIKEMNSDKKYNDDEFMETYCKYDNKNATKKICEAVILNKKNDLEYRSIKNNGKENVLIFAGNLAMNGITKSLLTLLNSIDTNKKNYFITYDTRAVSKHKESIRKLPENVGYIPIKGRMNIGFFKKLMMFLYSKRIFKDYSKYIEKLKPDFRREIKRIYPNTNFSTVIQFNGYNIKRILLYSEFECNRVIFAHNDMYKEAVEKKNAQLPILKYAYENYDKVALVTEDLVEPISKIANINGKYHVVHNIIDYNKILEESKKEICYDEKTESTVELEELRKVLDSKNKKFITIGRFSKEKGQERLIDAFEKLYEKDKSIYLIIIGGYGREYIYILEKIQNLSCKNNIIVIKYVSNPYAILNKCDYFILPSFYEGFGLVIAEADILGKPVVSTNIVGPTTFMKKYGGTLVENSEEGVYEGLKLLYENKVKPMNVDFEEYNKEAIKEFEDLLK